jgi:hypothetical protein
MPQPFKRNGRQVRMAASVVVERPAFGVLIAAVSTHWNKIEQSLGTMYTWLLMGQEPSAFEFYHKLIDLKLKEIAFMTAAEGKLAPQLIADVQNLYIDLRKLSKRRAKIIHGTWCSTPERPESLLLADPRHMNQKLNEMLRYIVDIKKDKSKLKIAMSFRPFPMNTKNITSEILIAYSPILEPDSKGYLRARRLIAIWIAARVTKAVRVSARFS